MDAKHTPGPWTIAEGSNAAVVWGPLKHAADYQICRCDQQGTTDDETHNVNARLIAAAPDLLAALTLALTRLETLEATHYHGDTETTKACRAAIAKATGPA